MKEIGSRFLRTLRVERENFVWMDFNDRATGDGFYLVLITQLLIFMGLFGFGSLRNLTNRTFLEIFFAFMIDGIVFWLLAAGLTYAIIRFLYQEDHNFPAILRISGYAYPTRLLVVFFGLYLSSPFLVFLLGSAWYLFIIAKGITATGDLAIERAALAAVGGVIAALVVEQILLGLPGF